MLRISGLIRFSNYVRQQLAGPLSAAEKDRLRRLVVEQLATVDRILREGNGRLQNLPAPSQRAYRFLAGIDWNQVASGTTSVELPAAKTMVAWRGLGTLMESVLGALARQLPETEKNAIASTITRQSRQIELTIQREDISPDRLSPITRAQRGWLGYFSQPENFAAYIAARQTAGRVLDAAATNSQKYPPPILVHFRPMRGIYRLTRAPLGCMLWLPTPMIAFDEAQFTTLSRNIFSRDREPRQQVIDSMTGEGFQSVRAELESLGGIVEQTRGAAHDLAESFDRVNARYFEGKMPRPRLTWNRTFTGRKFGHYDWLLDTVMVSRTLDAATVPSFVADYLMFHELLHKFHGVHWVNGRGYAHTAEFYASERKFERLAEAERILTTLARRP